MLKYHFDDYSPAYDIMPFLPLTVFGMCYGWIKCEIKVLPPFTPNEYLYTKHEDKGEERWEIYAWAIREIMAEVGGLIKDD